MKYNNEKFENLTKHFTLEEYLKLDKRDRYILRKNFKY